MRKKANKLLALLTAVAITVTGVNVPANNASAASAKLSAKKVTLTAGKKKTIYLKKGKKKLAIKSVKSSKKKVATVKKSGKKIVITAKKKGTATITVKAKVNKKVKSFKCKVTVKAKAATAAPTAAPSAAASSAPASQAPASAAPASAAPSDAASAVPSSATDASAAPSADASAAPSADASAEPSADASAAPSAEPTVAPIDKVPTKILIAGGLKEGSDKEYVQQALTNKNGTEAYVYYDVLNKDGKSIRSYIDLQWNTSPAGAVANKTTGRIKIKKGTTATDKFNYGDKIFLNAVYQGNGADNQPMVLTESAEVSVGLQQNVDSIKIAGFINKNDNPFKVYTKNDSGVVEALEDFAPDTWYLAFKTFDQNGNELDVTDAEFGSKNVNIISKNPMAVEIDSTLANAKTFSVTEKDADNADVVNEYAGVPIKPGDWVDRGEEVTLMIVSSMTGTQSEYVFTIGQATLLQSLKITGVKDGADLADGDQGIELTYTALDTKGNEITSYEAIVRGSNKLNLSCSPGTLTISETDEGKAKITWSDDPGYAKYRTAESATPGVGTFDNVQRYLNIVTTVVGSTGVTNTTPLYIGDLRVPKEIKSVDSTKLANALMETDDVTAASVTLAGNGALTFQDQYGATLNATKAANFFAAASSTAPNTGWDLDGKAYGVKVKVPAAGKLAVTGGLFATGTANATVFTSGKTMAVDPGDAVATAGTDTLRFAVTSFNTKMDNAATLVNDEGSWDSEGKDKSYDIAVVGMKDLQDLKITNVGDLYEVSAVPASGSGVRVEKGTTETTAITSANFTTETLKAKITGSYKGLTVAVPASKGWFTTNADSKFTTAATGALGNMDTTGMTEKDFFDFATYNNPAKKSVPVELRINVAKDLAKRDAVSGGAIDPTTATGSALSAYMNTIYTEVKVSAEPAAPTTISLDDKTLNPTAMVLSSTLPTATIKTQYGKTWTANTCVYTVSGITQATGKDVHVADDVVVTGNGSASPSIDKLEIGDSFTYTAKAVGLSLEKAATIKVGADTRAKISTNSTLDTDEAFRKGPLGMKR